MKKVVFILAIFLYAYCNAQELQKNYFFNTNFLNTDTGVNFKEGYKIKVIDIIKSSDGNDKKDKVVFTVYKFKTDTTGDPGYSLNKILYKTDSDFITHKMERENFNKYTDPIYPFFRGVRAGFYTIPFKIRIDDFDFEQNINFGMNVGFQFRFNKKIEDRWLYEPAIGIGLSSINLNVKNSDVTEERTASAFSTSMGLILHFDKNINLGVFYGLDFLGNNDKEVNWKYDQKPWIGIGINIGFSISEGKESESRNVAPDDNND